ncbi:hypothetical protein O6P43_022197 [Quillaja saponaria]|uniref:Uncharacterized protein n=1 Tax=Quillaja saponaria TaxID=32244 RepID=A0AAD7LCL4_QUISA|nr:hypothetical protein O6P43_022197 [Quillaja saponaria]
MVRYNMFVIMKGLRARRERWEVFNLVASGFWMMLLTLMAGKYRCYLRDSARSCAALVSPVILELQLQCAELWSLLLQVISSIPIEKVVWLLNGLAAQALRPPWDLQVATYMNPHRGALVLPSNDLQGSA